MHYIWQKILVKTKEKKKSYSYKYMKYKNNKKTSWCVHLTYLSQKIKSRRRNNNLKICLAVPRSALWERE